jgi:pre-mRNA-splicing factor SPF27
MVASSLIAQERTDSSLSTASLHPSIPTDYTANYSDLLTASHEYLASSTTTPPTSRPANSGIDLSRYEEPSAPTTKDRAEWSAALRAAYTSHAYLTQRALNLSLLEKYGNNAWLIANSQAEDELRTLEKELQETKRQVESVEEERRNRQEAVRGEIEGLDGVWREGVGRAIEAEVASEGLRRQVLEKRRAGGAA